MWTSMVRPLLDAGLLHPVPGPASLGLDAVTVVIPVRDRWEALHRLLPTLTELVRVIVVDDGSSDGSGEMAAALRADVVRRPRSGGPAAARNAGLALVATPLVAFVDSDIRLEPGWHKALLPHFNDPTVAIVAPRVVGDVAERSDRLARYEVARSPLDIGPQGGYVRSGNRASYLPAAILLARTEAMTEMAGFDSELTVGEDVDLVWRLGDAGWRVRYEPASTVFHDARPSLLTLLRRRVDYGTSAAALHRRHPGKVAPIGVSPWSAAIWSAALLGQFGLAGLVAGGTTARLARSLKGRVRDRWRASWLVAAHGHRGAARMLASAVSRAWLPLALLAMLRWPRTRPALAAALVVPPLVDWSEHRPPLHPVSYSLLYLADDAAYCSGVWLGCIRHFTAGPLLPRLYRQAPILPEPGIRPEPLATRAHARGSHKPSDPDPTDRRFSSDR
jgi:mycofactocin system glycosyltransferase